MEVFVKGYEGIYSITSDGEVFSYARDTKYKRKLVPDKNGYLTVNFNVAGVKVCKKVHRLVAEQFIPNLENKSQVNHKNGIKTDNTINNLEWVTNAENIKHMWKNNLKPVHRLCKRSTTGEPLIRVANKSFSVAIKQDRVQYYLGIYSNLLEAIKVRDKALSALKEGKILEYTPKRTIISQIQGGIIINTYSSIREAEKYTLVASGSISKVVSGKASSAGGYFWSREIIPATLNGEEII